MFKLDESDELSPEETRAVNKLEREIDEYLEESDRGAGKIYFPLPPWCLNPSANVRRRIIEIYEEDDWTVRFEHEEEIKYITFG